MTTKHKEEGIHRRELDTADRDQSSDLVNIVNRKVADKCINVRS